MFDVMFHRLSKCAMDPFAQFAEPKNTLLALVRVVEKVIFWRVQNKSCCPWLVGWSGFNKISVFHPLWLQPDSHSGAIASWTLIAKF